MHSNHYGTTLQDPTKDPEKQLSYRSYSISCFFTSLMHLNATTRVPTMPGVRGWFRGAYAVVQRDVHVAAYVLAA